MAELGKKLGKLSLAILENFVEGTLGEKFVDELRAPTDRALAISAAIENTEARFVSKFHDKELSKALFVDLKQKDRPILKDAIGKFYDHPTDSNFSTALQKILFGEFKKLSKTTVKQAIDFYVEVLTEELALVDETFRENVRALADLRGERSQQEMVEILRRVETLLSQKEAAKIESTVFRSLHQLPPPPADFTGREQLVTQLLKDFESHKGAAISGLTGMGGIGKTALGLEVARKLAEKYPDAQIFLDLKGTTTPLSALDIARHIILSFEPTMDLRALDETNMSAAYQSVLHGKKALLFFDNARSAEQIAPLRPPETCAMLVTSRWSFSVPGLQFHPVRVMEEDEANGFLLLLCPRINEIAAEISKICGYLPLALRIAGSFLREYIDWTPREYSDKLRERKLTLLKLDENSDLNVEACLKLSYQQLSEKDQLYWRSIGVFPSSFTRETCTAIWDIHNEETHEILSRFCRMSLLDYYSESLSYRLHDLLYEYAGKLASNLESTDISIKFMEHIQANPSLLLSFSEDFHPVNFDPESHFVSGADLIKTDPHKAIAYYSGLLDFLRAAPWILNDAGMVRLAEISCNLLALAFEKVGEKDKATYSKMQAALFTNMREQGDAGQGR